MKVLKQFIFASALGASLAFSLAGHAQTASMTASVNAAAADMTEAEVRKVDKENKKITLKHGAIKNLDMPPMTMVFQVGDASMLDKVQVGDKVLFTVVNEGGKMTVTQLQPAK